MLLGSVRHVKCLTGSFEQRVYEYLSMPCMVACYSGTFRSVHS